MVELIPAKCPRCGADLQLPGNLDRAHCVYCGGEVIISKPEIHIYKQDSAIACPECNGKGSFPCEQEERKQVSLTVFPTGDELIEKYHPKLILLKQNKYDAFFARAMGCNGTGKCTVSQVGKWTESVVYDVEKQTNKLYVVNIAGWKRNQCNNGKCTNCNGTGQIRPFFSAKECPMCKGTGQCQVCKGEAVCTLCNGTGNIECNTCKGTGVKVLKI